MIAKGRSIKAVIALEEKKDLIPSKSLIILENEPTERGFSRSFKFMACSKSMEERITSLLLAAFSRK